MKSDNLLNKYFEGYTNADEERQLKSKKSTANNLYFSLMNEGNSLSKRDFSLEAKILSRLKNKKKKKLYFTYSRIAVAASLLILISTFFTYEIHKQHRTKMQVNALMASTEKMQTLNEGFLKLDMAIRSTSNVITLNDLDKRINDVTSQIEFKTTMEYLPSVPKDTSINN